MHTHMPPQLFLLTQILVVELDNLPFLDPGAVNGAATIELQDSTG